MRNNGSSTRVIPTRSGRALLHRHRSGDVHRALQRDNAGMVQALGAQDVSLLEEMGDARSGACSGVRALQMLSRAPNATHHACDAGRAL